jgi:hypothetical protein
MCFLALSVLVDYFLVARSASQRLNVLTTVPGTKSVQDCTVPIILKWGALNSNSPMTPPPHVHIFISFGGHSGATENKQFKLIFPFPIPA